MRSVSAIRNETGVFCGSFLQKGEVFAFVGLSQTKGPLESAAAKEELAVSMVVAISVAQGLPMGIWLARPSGRHVLFTTHPSGWFRAARVLKSRPTSPPGVQS